MLLFFIVKVFPFLFNILVYAECIEYTSKNHSVNGVYKN